MKCNICGGADFGAGPNGRMAKTNLPPHCHGCGSLERQRVVRRIFQAFPLGFLDQRQALKFDQLDGLDVQWFQSVEIIKRDSISSDNLQVVGWPDAKYDFIALNHILEFIEDDRALLTELLRTLAPSGLLEIGFSNPMERETCRDFPDGSDNRVVRHLYGRDVLDHFSDIFQGLTVLVVGACDPCTGVREYIHLFFRDIEVAQLANQWLQMWGSSEVQLVVLPSADTVVSTSSTGPSQLEQLEQNSAFLPLGDPFAPLRQELSIWQSNGRRCPFWWRDDDLVSSGPLLAKMAALAQQFDVKVLVAVIPAQAEANLAVATQDMTQLVFCQHGFDHKNYELTGSPNGEFGSNRPLVEVERDIRDGHSRMQKLFEKRFFPVFVPPWNCLQEKAHSILVALKFIGLSQYCDQMRVENEGLRLVNTHVDIMQWAKSPNVRCHSATDLVSRLVVLLRQRRLEVDIEHEPIGILSHHRVMGQDAWQFMSELLSVTKEFSCVQWLAPEEVFAVPASSLS